MVTLAVGVGLVSILIAMPFRSGLYALWAVVVLRALCDYGVVDSSRPMLVASLSSVLPVVAIVYALSLWLSGKLKLRNRWLLGLCVFVILWQIVALLDFGFRPSILNEVVRLLSILAVFAVATCAAGSLQHKSTFAISLFIPATAVASIVMVLPVPHTVVNDRFTYTFSHPNAAGVYFGVAFLVALGIAISGRSLLSIGVAVIALVLLTATASLTSLLAAAIGAVALLTVSPDLRSGRKVQIGFFGGILIFAAVEILNVSDRFSEFAASDATGDPDSFQWRLENWRLLIDQWEMSKIFGFGTGTTNSIIIPLGGPPHNVYVQFLVEYGLIGIVLFAVGYALFLKSSYKLARSGVGNLSGLSFGVVVYLGVCGLAGNTVGYTAAMYAAAAVVGLSFGEAWIETGRGGIPQLGPQNSRGAVL